MKSATSSQGQRRIDSSEYVLTAIHGCCLSLINENLCLENHGLALISVDTKVMAILSFARIPAAIAAAQQLRAHVVNRIQDK